MLRYLGERIALWLKGCKFTQGAEALDLSVNFGVESPMTAHAP